MYTPTTTKPFTQELERCLHSTDSVLFECGENLRILKILGEKKNISITTMLSIETACFVLLVFFIQHQICSTFGKFFHKILINWIVYDVLWWQMYNQTGNVIFTSRCLLMTCKQMLFFLKTIQKLYRRYVKNYKNVSRIGCVTNIFAVNSCSIW